MTDFLNELDSKMDNHLDNHPSLLAAVESMVSSDPDTFYSLSTVSPEVFFGDKKEFSKWVKRIKSSILSGYELFERDNKQFLVVLDEIPKTYEVEESNFKNLESILLKLGKSNEDLVKGRDYAGTPSNRAEFSFFHGSPERRKADRKFIQNKSKIKPLKLCLDREDKVEVELKPEYVIRELQSFARAVVFNPTSVFLGIRDEGRLYEGKAFFGKPEVGSDLYEDKIFGVFVDDQNYVFDWGWIVEDPNKSGYPKDWNIRFREELSDVRGKLNSVSKLKNKEAVLAAYHSLRGDCIVYYFNDCPSFMDRVTDDLTLLYDVNNQDRVNGFKLKNIGRVLSKLMNDRNIASAVEVLVEVDGQFARFKIPVFRVLVSALNEQFPFGLDAYEYLIRELRELKDEVEYRERTETIKKEMPLLLC